MAEERLQSWCIGCQRLRDKTACIQSINPAHDKFLPLCRSCMTARFKEYQEKTGSEGAAFWCMSAEMGYPVIKKYYKQAIEQKEKKSEGRMNLFMEYQAVLRSSRFKFKGFWQSDMMLDEFMDIGREKGDPEKWLEEQEKIWGKFDKEDYDLLNYYYNMHTEDADIKEPTLQLRYRDVAKGEVRLRKANESGDVAEIDKAQKNLKALLEMLGLNDYSKKETDERRLFIDRLAWAIEETEPCEEEDEEKYRDIAGYEKSFENIMRSMRNLSEKVKTYPPVPEEEQ